MINMQEVASQLKPMYVSGDVAVYNICDFAQIVDPMWRMTPDEMTAAVDAVCAAMDLVYYGRVRECFFEWQAVELAAGHHGTLVEDLS